MEVWQRGAVLLDLYEGLDVVLTAAWVWSTACVTAVGASTCGQYAPKRTRQFADRGEDFRADVSHAVQDAGYGWLDESGVPSEPAGMWDRRGDGAHAGVHGRGGRAS